MEERRRSDLDEEFNGERKRIADVMEAIARVETDLKEHVDKAFAGHHSQDHQHLEERMDGLVKEHVELKETADDNSTKLDKVITALYGPVKFDVDGHTYRGGGFLKSMDSNFQRMADDMSSLRATVGSGGVPAKVELTRGQKIAIAAIAVPVTLQFVGWLIQTLVDIQAVVGG